MPFDQFHAHLVREKAVLEIGAIVDPRRQDGNNRLALAPGWRAGRQRTAQLAGILADFLHLDPGKQLGKHLQHGFPIFEHVADAGRGAGIVLEHVKFVIPGADNIGSDNMGIDAAGRIDADHLRQKGSIVGDKFDRHPARPQYFLTVIDIVEKGVDRPDPLFDAFRKLAPLASRKHARYHIKRDQPLVGLILAIDIEGDSGLPEKGFRLGGFAMQPFDVFAIEPVLVVLIRRPDIFPATQHFIEQSLSPCTQLSNPSSQRVTSAQKPRTQRKCRNQRFLSTQTG